MFAPAGTIGAIEALRNDIFQTHVARDLEQSGADHLALLVFGDEYAVDGVGEQPGQSALAQRQRPRLDLPQQKAPLFDRRIGDGVERLLQRSF
jgi:hypothetical protein